MRPHLPTTTIVATAVAIFAFATSMTVTIATGATQEISFDATTLTIVGFGLIAFQFFVVANL